MAGQQLREAAWLPPPGFPVSEHPQVSTPPVPPDHPPVALQILGTQTLAAPAPCVPVLEIVGGRHR